MPGRRFDGIGAQHDRNTLRQWPIWRSTSKVEKEPGATKPRLSFGIAARLQWETPGRNVTWRRAFLTGKARQGMWEKESIGCDVQRSKVTRKHSTTLAERIG